MVDMYHMHHVLSTLSTLSQETEIAPVIAPYWERAEFPHALLPALAKLGLGGGTLKGHGCAGLSINAAAIASAEIARVDGSMSTFVLVHNFLAMLTIGLLGSEEQKRELLPRMAQYQMVGSWALTEPTNGSDASGLLTTARKVSGGYVINGMGCAFCFHLVHVPICGTCMWHHR